MPDAYAPVWLVPSDVTGWLGLTRALTPDETTELDRVCVQTEAYVQRCRPDQYVPGDPDDTDPDADPGPPGTFTPDGEVYQGAVMYAARQLRRRNSPAGVESFGDIGVTFVTKYDADIERALRTGGWSIPGVG